MLNLHWVLWRISSHGGKIYVQFESLVYQQIVGIPRGTNSAPLIEDMFLYYYEKDFMSNLHKSKKLDFVDMFNDRHDILIIDNPQFETHIDLIYIRQNYGTARKS